MHKLSNNACSFLAHLQKNGSSEASVESRADALYSFERAIGHSAEDMTIDSITMFIGMKKRCFGGTQEFTRFPRSPRTNQHLYQIIRAFYFWLAERGEPVDPDVIDFFETQTISAPRKPISICYTRDEVELLFLAAHNGDKKSYAARNVLILAFAYYMCLRTSSITGIKLSDVDWDSRRVNVRLKGGNFTDKPIPSWLMPRLHRYVEKWRGHFTKPDTDQRYLFPSHRNGGSRMTVLGMENIMGSLLRRSGIDRSQYKGLHGLRHAGATHLSEKGESLHDIKVLLDHANVSITDKYLKNSLKKQADLVEKTQIRAIHTNQLNAGIRAVLRQQARDKASTT